MANVINETAGDGETASSSPKDSREGSGDETGGVNPQGIDTVTHENLKAVAEAPALALGTLYQSAAQSGGVLMANAVATQQQLAVTAHAAANQGVMMLFSMDQDSPALHPAFMDVMQTGTQTDVQTGSPVADTDPKTDSKRTRKR